jgi:hypothetical protein
MSVVERLPAELLVLILLQAINDPFSHQERLNLALVCWAWKTLVFSKQDFWTHMSTSAPAILALAARYSGVSHLTLDLKMPDEVHIVQAIVDIISPHRPRIRSFSFTYGPHGALLAKLFADGTAMTSLLTLDIVSRDSRAELISSIVPALPVLTSLTLLGHVDWCRPLFSSPSHLTYLNVWMTGVFPLRNLLCALKHLSQLLHLEYRHGSWVCFTEESAAQIEKVKLASILWIHLHLNWAALGDLVACLELNPRAQFSLTACAEDMRPADAARLWASILPITRGAFPALSALAMSVWGHKTFGLCIKKRCTEEGSQPSLSLVLEMITRKPKAFLAAFAPLVAHLNVVELCIGGSGYASVNFGTVFEHYFRVSHVRVMDTEGSLRALLSALQLNGNLFPVLRHLRAWHSAVDSGHNELVKTFGTGERVVLDSIIVDVGYHEEYDQRVLCSRLTSCTRRLSISAPELGQFY